MGPRRGATATEYALLIGLVGLVVMGSAGSVGERLGAGYGTIESALGTADDGNECGGCDCPTCPYTGPFRYTNTDGSPTTNADAYANFIASGDGAPPPPPGEEGEEDWSVY